MDYLLKFGEFQVYSITYDETNISVFSSKPVNGQDSNDSMVRAICNRVGCGNSLRDLVYLLLSTKTPFGKYKINFFLNFFFNRDSPIMNHSLLSILVYRLNALCNIY